MPEVLPSCGDARASARPYQSPLEHLSDELRWLDLLLASKMPQVTSNFSSNLLAQLKGLVLCQEDVDLLLKQPAGLSAQVIDGGAPEAAEQKALAKLATEISHRRAASVAAGIHLPLHEITRIFSLSPLEERCLLLCLALEVDRKYEKLYAFLNDDLTRRKPAVGLILDLLCSTFESKIAARTSFMPQGALRKYRLVEMAAESRDDRRPLLSREIGIDERTAGYLLGSSEIHPLLAGAITIPAAIEAAPSCTTNEAIKAKLRRFIDTHISGAKSLLFVLRGPDGAGREALVRELCHDLRFRVVVAEIPAILDSALSFPEGISLAAREALLQPAVLCLRGVDRLVANEDNDPSHVEAMLEAVDLFSQLTFVLCSRRWRPRRTEGAMVVEVDLPLPDEGVATELWQASLQASSVFPTAEAGSLASTFRFTPGQIRNAVAAAEDLAEWRAGDAETGSRHLLYAACRAQSDVRLSSLARKVEPVHSWQDLVLPADQVAQLREICNQARCRHIVYGAWGFNRKLSQGKGLAVLFSGSSGTGKTMGAEVIARELGLDLYMIDLSRVVDKYIGETEKNLERIFHEARACNAILFFDEADALFGKRTEVKDAHDRYANIEVGYLLQEMEAYEGITILATNLVGSLDQAFTRRLHFILELPFPDAAQRMEIWRKVFPAEAPLAAEVDLPFLSEKLKVAGGNIRNIAVAAAFFAAGDSAPIGMKHLMLASKRELQKMGNTFLPADFQPYYHLAE